MNNRQPISTFLGITAAVVLATNLHAVDIFVNGTCGNDAWSGLNNVCLGPDGPKATIQAGINAANAAVIPGDVVIVAEGTYIGNINFLGKAITVRSTNPNDAGVVMHTIIKGGGIGSVVTCANGEGPGTILSGFVITGGVALRGGGMHNAGTSPTVVNCSFIGNTAIFLEGGGMFNMLGSPTVTNCTFTGNIAQDSGGGMYNLSANPTVTNCSFCGNTAVTASGSGGGMYNDGGSSPTVTNCTFSGNIAEGSVGLRGGGGMFNEPGSTPTVTHCTFSGNMATSTNGSGGGMLNSSSSPTVTKCMFSGNTAGNRGGGMYNELSSPPVTDCSFCGNKAAEGGGMYNGCANPTVTDCSFSRNVAIAGGGMFNAIGIGCPIPILTNTGLCLNEACDLFPLGSFIDGGGTSLMYCQPPRAACPADINGDSDVGVPDLLALLAAWGPCP